MTLSEIADRIVTRRRAPLVAAFIALLAAMPGLFTLPTMDRDEARFAEASAQMLETGDFTNIMYQQTPRYKKPVGAYWLQALSVGLLSSPEARRIWAYRAPSVLGAMLAAGACAWGSLAFLRPALAATAGGLLAATTVLSTESILATTDAALCGAVTLSMAALARIYLAAHGGPGAGRWTRLLFWLGLSASVLLKGPIGPMVVALTMLALALWDRKASWLAGLDWDWGLIIFAGLVLPWAFAITVVTDGRFWGTAIGGDLAPKLLGGQEGHGQPFGFYALLSPLLLFPATLLLPSAVAEGWRSRVEPGVRFALCWLIPSWLVFELTPTKLVHYVLPTFGALAWLMAASLARPIGARSRWIGAALAVLAALALSAVGGVAAADYGQPWSWVWEALAGALLLAAALAGGWLLVRRHAWLAATIACGLGVLGHDVLAGGLAPTLKGLWLSQRVAEALARDGLDPREGLTQGPVTVAGYAEPSLVFALGTPTVLGSAADAAEAVAEGRPAVVEGRVDAEFRRDLAAAGGRASVVGVVSGLDYSDGRSQVLRIYRPAAPASQQ